MSASDYRPPSKKYKIVNPGNSTVQHSRSSSNSPTKYTPLRQNPVRVPAHLDTTKGGEVVKEENGQTLVSIYARKLTKNDGTGNYGNSHRAIFSPSGLPTIVTFRYDASRNIWFASASQETRQKLLDRKTETFGCGSCGTKMTVIYY